MYRIEIKDRLYSEWKVFLFNDDSSTFDIEIELPKINPLKLQLFHGDIFQINSPYSTDKIQLIDSVCKKKINIPGVLLTKDNKTFGRAKNGKLLYKCIPNDVHLPAFLIPFEMKNVGFIKVFVNQYITFSFESWNDKHPHGQIQNIIGSVDEIVNYYEYELFCKSLNQSLQKLGKKINDKIKGGIAPPARSIESRMDRFVFSIDPEDCTDFDDAFSIQQTDDILCVSIYISNVAIYLDNLQLWGDLTSRVSTIYLPDKKRPMLPSILSENICSLKEGGDRFAFTLDIFIKENEIVDAVLSNTKIRVKKNFVYEEDGLLNNPDYALLLKICRKLMDANDKYKYIDEIKDSHDLVAYLMILMNYYCAKELMKFNNGIFRATSLKDGIQKGEISDTNKTIENPEIQQFVKIWNSYSTDYIDLKTIEDVSQLKHTMMNLDAYVHITSPIRRLVDLLNMIQLQINLRLYDFSPQVIGFHQSWIKKRDDINADMKNIKRVQNNCITLYTLEKNPLLLDKIFEGYILQSEKNGYIYEYSIYIPELKLISYCKMDVNMDLYSKCKVQLYLFQDEEKYKNKIRVQII